MRRFLKLALLLAIGLAFAKPGGSGPNGPDGSTSITPNGTDPADSPRVKTPGGANAVTNWGDAKTEIDKSLDDGEAGDGTTTDKDGDGQPDSTTNPSDSIAFDQKKLNKKFKHASDFGIEGNNNFANQKKFQEAMEAHVDSPETNQVQGTYRGDDVLHYVDPNTGLNVITTPSGEFVSAWKLSSAQLQHVLTTGDLGGG